MAGHWTPDIPAHGDLNWDAYVTAADSALDQALFDHSQENTSAHGGIVAANDPRLSDARTPLGHASTHGLGQQDQITPASIGAVGTALLGASNGVATLDASGNNAQSPQAHTHQAYSRIRVNGADMNQRTKLNFVGASVTDDPTNDATVVTVTANYAPIEMVVAADVSKASNTSFSPITGLSFSIEANATYLLDMCLVYQAGGTGDLDLRISGPAGSTVVGTLVGNNGAAGNDAAGVKRGLLFGATGTSVGPFGGFGSNGSVDGQRIRIVNGATAGTISIDFAQDALDANNTIIRAGSNASAVRTA